MLSSTVYTMSFFPKPAVEAVFNNIIISFILSLFICFCFGLLLVGYLFVSFLSLSYFVCAINVNFACTLLRYYEPLRH